MKFTYLVSIISIGIVTACNSNHKQVSSAESGKNDSAKNHIQDSVRNNNSISSNFEQTVKTFNKVADSLKLDEGAFPVLDYLSDTIGDDGYCYALFYLKFMDAAKKRDKALIKSMIHFPFQTTPQKSKYNKAHGDYEVAGAENWAGGVINEHQFDLQFEKIFTEEILNNISETRPKDLVGMLPGNSKPSNDYDSRLKDFTDRGSNIYMVNLELPVKKRNYGYVYYTFGRIKGEYKILSYFLQ